MSVVVFQLTTACGWKLVPVTDNVKAGEPAGTLDGETLATAGAGAREGPLEELPDPPEQPARMESNAKELPKKK